MSKRDANQQVELLAYSIEQAAAAMGIDKERMGGLCRAGVVPHIRLGARVVIGRAAFEEWLTDACWANARQPLGGQLTEPRQEPLRRRAARLLREAERAQ